MAIPAKTLNQPKLKGVLKNKVKFPQGQQKSQKDPHKDSLIYGTGWPAILCGCKHWILYTSLTWSQGTSWLLVTTYQHSSASPLQQDMWLPASSHKRCPYFLVYKQTYDIYFFFLMHCQTLDWDSISADTQNQMTWTQEQKKFERNIPRMH